VNGWSSSSGSGQAKWGEITGTLTDQTDLKNSLDSKLSDTDDSVKDNNIDWGSAVGQVDADDIPDGSTNIIPTKTQETNWDNHINTDHDYSYISSNDANTDITGVELETLSDGSNADSLHTHSPDIATSVITSDLSPLVVMTRYIVNKTSGGTCLMVLPASFSVGDRVLIVGKGSQGWKVTSATGDTIVYGNLTTVSGGYIASTHCKDCVELVCTEDSAEWQITNSVGNIEVETS